MKVDIPAGLMYEFGKNSLHSLSHKPFPGENPMQDPIRILFITGFYENYSQDLGRHRILPIIFGRILEE